MNEYDGQVWSPGFPGNVEGTAPRPAPAPPQNR